MTLEETMAVLYDIEETYRGTELLVLSGSGEHRADVARILSAIATHCADARMLIKVLEVASRPPRAQA